MQQQKQTEDSRDVVIEVRGGTVVATYSDLSSIRMVLVDWDEWEEQDQPEDFRGGVFPHSPLKELPEETLEAYRSAD